MKKCNRSFFESMSVGAQGVLLCALLIFSSVQVYKVSLHLQRGLTYWSADYPGAALPFVGKRVVVPLEWGGFVLWHTAPCSSVSLDGRYAQLYPETLVVDHRQLLQGEEQWRKTLAAWRPDTILIKRDTSSHLGFQTGFSRERRGQGWDLYRIGTFDDVVVTTEVPRYIDFPAEHVSRCAH